MRVFQLACSGVARFSAVEKTIYVFDVAGRKTPFLRFRDFYDGIYIFECSRQPHLGNIDAIE